MILRRFCNGTSKILNSTMKVLCATSIRRYFNSTMKVSQLYVEKLTRMLHVYYERRREERQYTGVVNNAKVASVSCQPIALRLGTQHAEHTTCCARATHRKRTRVYGEECGSTRPRQSELCSCSPTARPCLALIDLVSLQDS